MTDTIRELCLSWLEASFIEQRAGKPDADPYGITWDTVQRESLSDSADRVANAIGIYDTTEEMVDRLAPPQKECTLRVLLEFKCRLSNPEKSSKGVNRILGEIQRVIRKDNTLGGNAINFTETSNENTIDGVGDRFVVGVVYCSMLYRRAIGDPRRYI